MARRCTVSHVSPVDRRAVLDGLRDVERRSTFSSAIRFVVIHVTPHRLRASAARRALFGALVGVVAWGGVAGAQSREEVAADTTIDRRPLAAFSASASTLRDSIVALARAQIGRRYKLGGTTPERGFDCSGLVKYIMAALEVELPRTANQQSTRGEAVPRDTSRLRPGDLLTFGRGKRVTHIAIYVGEGRYVHASTRAGRVIETSLDRPSPLLRVWQGARRILAMSDDTTAATTTPH
jgi:cell wall-associated NlpC family hydrolase